MTDHARACPGCRRYTALREAAKQAGEYQQAADYEVLRRRHPSHDEPDRTTARWGLPA